jgi:hypothetical protein
LLFLLPRERKGREEGGREKGGRSYTRRGCPSFFFKTTIISFTGSKTNVGGRERLMGSKIQAK